MLEKELAQFIGTTAYHRLTLYPMLATDGVAYFAEKAGAYWLMNEIAYILSANIKVRKEEFVVVIVDVKDNKAIIKYEDGNCNQLAITAINFTDLEEGVWKFFITDKVIMLPSEY